MYDPTTKQTELAIGTMCRKMSHAVSTQDMTLIGYLTQMDDDDMILAHVHACRSLVAAAELSAAAEGIDLTRVPPIANIQAEMRTLAAAAKSPEEGA